MTYIFTIHTFVAKSQKKFNERSMAETIRRKTKREGQKMNSP
jgi:hypothetical protein